LQGTGPYYYAGGGGAGGSIWITASNLTGSGSIAANGGRSWSSPYGTGGGGGGGRIAIYYTNYTFSGVISVNGGSGSQPGQPGTVYTIPHEKTLALDTQVLGFLTTPFSVDSWSLNALAGQQVSLQQVNMSAPTVVFDFSGPNGWTGFTGITNQSALLTLPTSGTYTLTTRGTGGAGGTTYTFDLQETAETNITINTPFSGSLLANGQAQLFMFSVTNATPMLLTLDNAGAGNVTEVYVSLGRPPTRASYAYHSTIASSSSQQILIPQAVIGTYYALVYANHIPTPGTYTLSATTSSLFLTSVFPASLANGADATITLTGAGFAPSTIVQLQASDGTAYSPASASVDSFTQVTATFAANSVPVGRYSVKLSKADGSSSELTNAFQFTPGAQPNLVTSLTVPSVVGRHEPSSIEIYYANTGSAAMPAPLLLLTASQTPMFCAPADAQADAGEAFWTSVLPPGWHTNVQILASGQTPGVLQPGESNTVVIDYAGLVKPWLDINTIEFDLGVLQVTNTSPIDWGSLQSVMQPPNMPSDAWAAIYENLTKQLGPTWGAYVQTLDYDSGYLGRLGLNVTDIGQLLSFEAQRADAMNIVQYLSGSLDAYVATPGLALSFQRLFPQNISARYRISALGRGWFHNWDLSLSNAPDGSSVTVFGPGASIQTFLSSTLGGYYDDAGDYGQLTSIGANVFNLREANGNLEAFRSDGKLDYVQDPNGNRVSCSYTGKLLTSLTHSSGQLLTFTYNSSGLISKVADTAGRQTVFDYDATGQHLVSTIYPDATSAVYTYTDSGTASANATLAHDLTQITFSSTNDKYFSYDNQGRLASMNLNGGAQALNFAYDSQGGVLITDAYSQTTSFYLDNNGMLVKAQNPFADAVLFAYDANFNLTTFTDPTGRIYDFGYDANGNLTRFTDALGKTANLAYKTPLNRLASLLDANANLTTYANDTNGNLSSINYADGSVEKWSYDRMGNPLALTNRRGQAILFQFNTNGQPTAKIYPDGRTINYYYNTHFLPTNISDSVQGATRLAFDLRDYLTNIVYPSGKGFSFIYDSSGRRISRVGFDGYALNYGYDAAGRLATLTDGSNNMVVQYAYDANGHLTRETKGNGTYTTYAYNAAWQLASMTNYAPNGSIQSFFNYLYDIKGNRSGMTNMVGVTTYAYDDLNQLTGAIYPNARQVTYAYDSVGNRKILNDTGTNSNYVVNPLNEYGQAGGSTFCYDADGNITNQTSAAGTISYQYDAENRLVGVATPTNGTWQFIYDSLGNRTATVYNGATNQYLLDVFGLVDVAAEYDSTGNLVARYDHGLGLVAREDNGGNAAYYSFDVMGNTRQLTGNDGSILNSYDYDAFGAITSSSETVSNNFTLLGRFGISQLNQNTYFMRARYFDSCT